MINELDMLAYATILGLVQLMLAAHLGTRQRGLGWNIGPRDQKPVELAGMAGRMDRAFKNFLETFPFFVAAVVLVVMTNKTNSTSSMGATLYFAARVIYVPMYALGIPLLRTLVWTLSVVGILMIGSNYFF